MLRFLQLELLVLKMFAVQINNAFRVGLPGVNTRKALGERGKCTVLGGFNTKKHLKLKKLVGRL